jgi:hypothetical protein
MTAPIDLALIRELAEESRDTGYTFVKLTPSDALALVSEVDRLRAERDQWHFERESVSVALSGVVALPGFIPDRLASLVTSERQRLTTAVRERDELVAHCAGVREALRWYSTHSSCQDWHQMHVAAEALAATPASSLSALRREVLEGVFDHIKHGDEKHQEWLREKLRALADKEQETDD